MNKREIGFKYENVAKEYLILQGLTFVEVKYRKNDFFGSAIEMVTEEKQNKILASSQIYLLKKEWDKNVRYDIVGVSRGSSSIEWLKNAF